MLMRQWPGPSRIVCLNSAGAGETHHGSAIIYTGGIGEMKSAHAPVAKLGMKKITIYKQN